ncbi:MAG: phosphoribosylformylglycinamidine synthase I [Methanoculleaceae archaeon]
MRFAVLEFGGSNCDRDTVYVLQEICGVDTDLVWYKGGLRRRYDAVILPGGFSYGDYLRAGAIAARTQIMEQVRRHVREGRLLLGICNGAQIGTESGLVPGTFTMNLYPKFICEDALLRVETSSSPFTNQFRKGEIISIPIAHKEGRYVADPETVASLNREDRVAFRFCDSSGACTDEANPNGSVECITGLLNDDRNVLVMMPHPERASEAVLGSEDGRRIFTSMITFIEENG